MPGDDEDGSANPPGLTGEMRPAVNPLDEVICELWRRGQTGPGSRSLW
jgi:hypothetical protein